MPKSLGEIALSYTEKLKFQIFPLQERSKIPATKRGHLDAVSDPAIIKEWWEQNPNYNIGLKTGEASGVWVLDVDGPQGESDLAELEAKYGKLPKTPTQATGKGRHIIFKNPPGLVIGNRAKLIRHDIPEGLDVRGAGGYIVLAPSIHPDTWQPYKWVIKPTDCDFQLAPQWLLDLVVKPLEPSLNVAARIFNPPPARIAHRTNPEAIIADQLQAIRSAPPGTRNHTLNVAAMKVGKVIEAANMSEGEAKSLLTGAALQAGLDQAEIPATINSGMKFGLSNPYKYGQKSETGILVTEQKQQDTEFDQETGEVIQPPNKFTILTYDEIALGRRVEWLVKGVFPKKSFGVIYGKPGQGKTFVALDFALCVAHGMQWHDLDVVQGSVLYIAGEGLGGLGKRLRAWTSQNAPNEPTPPFYAITANVNMRDTNDVNDLILSIDSLHQQFEMIIIDTVARSLTGGDENSSTDMGLFVAACDAVKDHTGSAVIGVHHSGKDDEKGMRGSSALLGAVDTVLHISQDEEESVVLTMEKQKDAEAIKDMKFNMVVITTGITETSVVLSLSDDQVVVSKGAVKRVDLYLEALWDCIASDTKTLNGVPATSWVRWKEMCASRMLGSDNPDAQRQAMKRAKDRLAQKHLIFVDGGLVSYTGESHEK